MNVGMAKAAHDGLSVAIFTCFLPHRHSYHIYIKEGMERLKKNIPDTNIRFAKINQEWKQLSFVQKEAYKKKQEENIAKYSLDLQHWFRVIRFLLPVFFLLNVQF